ncbi:hypothetical protein AB0B45_40655 [Nonomuraea sp. NPDC049152]|uniref:hypothetical protein n=1 Tax=Nonomuraea sp. NPDC049152 TaxID=3154350 RepID=UPI0033E43F44
MLFFVDTIDNRYGALTVQAAAGGTPAVDLPNVRLPEIAQVRPAGGELELVAWDSTVPEQLLARGDIAVLGMCLCIGALLMRPLLLSVAEGRPFRKGNPARIAGLAGVVLFAGIVGGALPHVAALMVHTRLNLAGPGSPFVTHDLSISLTPIPVALLLLVLAESFRRGGELADDVEGMV